MLIVTHRLEHFAVAATIEVGIPVGTLDKTVGERRGAEHYVSGQESQGGNNDHISDRYRHVVTSTCLRREPGVQGRDAHWCVESPEKFMADTWLALL
jgi:hypothetical protein